MPRAGRGIAAFLGAVGLAGCGAHASGPTGHERLSVGSGSSLVDAPLRVSVSGLRAHGAATVEAAWRAYDGVVWRGSERIRAGVDGTAAVPVDRLLALLTPARTEPGGFFPARSARSPLRFAVAVGGSVAARASVVRRFSGPSVARRALTVARDGLYGAYYAAPSSRRRPAVVAIGGSDGGVPEAVAALLASHGYPALALGYFKGPGVPRALKRVPLEYFARALRWLGRRPGVDPRRLVVYGVSRGGEGALLIGSTFPRLVHGVIAMVPNYETWGAGDRSGGPAWTYRGRGIPPFTPIHVERIDGPILMGAAGEDAVWNSSGQSLIVVRTVREDRSRVAVRRLVFAHAGHDVGAAIPYLAPPVSRDYWGGSRSATAAGKAVLWRAVLRYLRSMSSTR